MARRGGTSRRWSATELAALRRWYPIHGATWDGWAERLPGRTPTAIRRMAARDGLRAWSAWDVPGGTSTPRQGRPGASRPWPEWGRLVAAAGGARAARGEVIA